MKRKAIIFLFTLLVHRTAAAQNVGIGNTNPAARLDINGDIAIRSADILINNVYTYALDVNTVKQGSYKIKAQAGLGNFIIAGITGAVEGRIISLTNRSGNSMEIYNEDATATAANRIQTGTGSTLAVYNNGTVTLQYDAAEKRWLIRSVHNNSLDYFGGGGASSWNITGTDIFNTNTGNVGIGNNSPGFKLDITGDQRIKCTPITSPGFSGNLTDNGGLLLSNNSDNLFLKIDGSKIQTAKPNLQVSGSSAAPFLINPYGGNVGINYSTPQARLFVLKGTNSQSPEGSFACFGTTYGSYFHFGTTEDTYIRGGKDGSKVIINDGALGNVGIGLPNPRCRLTVLNTAPLSNGNTEVLQVAGKNAMAIFSDQNGADYGYIKAVSDNTQTPQFSRAGIEIGTGGGDIYLSALGWQPALMVNGTTNNVGIGTNNPTQRLCVNGNIRAKEIIVETGWADYVFDDHYQLKKLEEVEDFIKQNNHLPGVPSATEIQNNGLQVGQLQTKMMEKIEELTLYVIELKKEIELLKNKK
ncbi:MAG: hypothetical protein QM791_09830 [Ferruginibacter sp.]